MGIAEGTCLPFSFPSFREFCALREMRGGAFEEIAARIAAEEEEEELRLAIIAADEEEEEEAS